MMMNTPLAIIVVGGLEQGKNKENGVDDVGMILVDIGFLEKDNLLPWNRLHLDISNNHHQAILLCHHLQLAVQ